MPSTAQRQIYLASRSPRRQDLLRQLGLHFTILPADVAEHRQPGQSPEEYALEMARLKAATAAAQAEAPWPVLGADTDVVLDGEVLGKPAGREQGIEMLLRLSGRRHRVLSAVAVCQGARVATALSDTEIEFAPLDRQMAAAYWATGEPADKAGGYAVQGLAACFIRSLRGSYSGVVGLPLHETASLLASFGIEVLPGYAALPPGPA